jgi:hypothetical protein
MTSVYAVKREWISEVGKSIQVVDCPCGYNNHFFMWSWAGHGKAKCKGCGRWINYRTLEVRQSDEGAKA